MNIELDRIVHCYPIAQVHECEGTICWCEPELEPVEGLDGKFGLVVIHRDLH